jgi:diacylglycerol O-acyltransferase / trehalose O-mycolyltransferase
VTQLKSCVHTVVAALIMVLPLLSITVAVADPPAGAHITDIQHVNDRWGKVSVYSPAMDKVVVNDVFKAPKAGSPTFYLLPGIDGGDNLDPGANFAPGTKSCSGSPTCRGSSPTRTSTSSLRSVVSSAGTPTGSTTAASSTRPT